MADTQVFDGQLLTDSDVDVAPPPKMARLKSKVFSNCVLQNLSDSDGEEPYDIEPPVSHEGSHVEIREVRGRALKMAEIFSGSGVLAKKMEGLGFSVRLVDYQTGGEAHDISQETIVSWPLFFCFLYFLFLVEAPLWFLQMGIGIT